MAIDPISPSEITDRKITTFPDIVIKIWNNAIVSAWNGKSAKILQTEITDRLASAFDTTRSNIFSLGYLDIEDMYRKAGWVVSYDKPSYCDDYDAYFTFSK